MAWGEGVAHMMTTEIHRCQHFVLCRQETIDRTVVTKTARWGLAPRAALQIRNEYSILRRLDMDGVSRPIALEGPEEAPTLVLEDAGSEDLEHRLAAGPLPLDDFFEIALQLSDICSRIHAKHIVHRALAPSHVVLGVADRVTLVHFADAAELTSVTHALDREPVAELVWMSPEQTGRMNRLVDWRSDLYSLGITLYAMLTGAPPFRSSDPLELVHAHMAQQPVPASVANPRVPQVLSAIVQKLLAKMPEWRYHSAQALAADLREAQRQWLVSSTIEPFELGRLDLAQELPLPERLYGRERELALLRSALARTSSGGVELVLVAGEAGIGKTALVGAVRGEVARLGGRFASGKSDLRAANMPYTSVVEALRALARSLLSEPGESRVEQSQQLLEAVQPNGRVLVELVPELRDVLGEVPGVPTLGPVEAENRLHHTLQSFVRAVAANRPLVLFLDDLQWTDAASLRLLRALATDPESQHVLLLGALRPRETGSMPLLSRTLDELQRAGVPTSRLELGPLGVDALVALLSDVLRCEPERARPLAELVLDKTAGNPFFVRALLRSLQRSGLLVFDAERGTWRWELRRIEQVGITENVIELMTASIRELPEEAQTLLQVAACIGKRVMLRALATVCGKSLDEMAARLGEVLQEGLLLPEDDRTLPAELSFRFVHDRVQQAAYALLSEEPRKRLYLKIGRRLLDLSRENALDEDLFEIVDQLNLGAELLEEPTERSELARLNHQAGSKARRSAAYGPALAYFQTGLALLPREAWESHYALSLALHRDAAECASLTGEHSLCRALVEEGLRHVATMVEAAELHALRIASATMIGEYRAALLWGWDALRAFFGIEPPEAASVDAEIAAQRKAIDVFLGGRSPEALIHQPLMSRPEDRVYMKIISEMMPPAWFTERKLLWLLTVSGVRFALEHGNCTESIMPYAFYAQLLVSVGERTAAEGFSRLALALARKFEDCLQETRAFQLYNTFVRGWSAPLSSCIAGSHQVYEMALQVGESQQAAYGRMLIVVYGFTAGMELDRLLVELNEGLVFCRKARSEGLMLTHLAYRQAIRCLKGLTRGRNRFDDDDFDEQAFLATIRSEPATECIYNILRLQTSYLFRDLTEARARAEAAERTVDLLGAYITSADHAFFTALTLLALSHKATPRERRETLARVAVLQQKLRMWEGGCAQTFRHKRLLVAAEVAQVRGCILKAANLYDQAIEAAQAERFLQDVALANELCGRLYESQGRIRVSHLYLRAAREGWAQWGASAKARALDEEFALGSGPGQPDTAEGGSSGAGLDALSLLKAAETLSSEIVLDSLLEKLMGVCLQAAGAERGVFISEEEGRPFVRAVGRVAQPVSLHRTPLAEMRQIPRQLIERVRRTRDVLVLDGAASDRELSSAPLLAEDSAKSLLVLPIQRKESLLGVFYFENDLTSHAYPRERVRVLELLSAQIAIALENSLLFEKLKVEVEERTRAERAVRFMAHASELLAESLDYPTTLRSLVRLIVPALADWCVVDVVEADEQIHRVALMHADPAKEGLLRELQERYSPDWTSPQPSVQVLRSGKPLLVSEVTDAVLQTYGRDADNARLIRELGTRSTMTVPLIARGRILGAISFCSTSPERSYGPADLALAEELARRVAMAIDNARLYRDAQEGIRVREEFLSVASHELKTPITVINLAFQALRRQHEHPSEEHAARTLRMTEKQVQRLQSLVDELLNVSLIQAGRLALQLDPVDLCAVVHEVVERFGESIARSRSRVDTHTAETVVGQWDSSRLDQVVSNLLENALKFGNGEPIALTVTRRDGLARLVVEDHGIGISPERLPHVFERFERAVSSRHYGGFGLGLYIVRSIVEALHGKVSVASTLGSGTTFTVELPCNHVITTV